MNLNNNNINIKKNNMKQNKNIKNLSSNGRKELSNENNKDFLNKKRKIPKIYQNVINKNQANINIQTPNKENENILNQEFSNFEL